MSRHRASHGPRPRAALLLVLLAAIGPWRPASARDDVAPNAPTAATPAPFLVAASDAHLWVVRAHDDGALVLHLPLLSPEPVATVLARLPARPLLVAAAGDRLWLVFAGDDARPPAVYAQRVRRHPLYDRWFGVPAGALELVQVLSLGDEPGALAATSDGAFVLVRRRGAPMLVSTGSPGRGPEAVSLPPGVPVAGDLLVRDAEASPPDLLLVPFDVALPARRLPDGAEVAAPHAAATPGTRVRQAGSLLVRLRPAADGCVPEILDGTGATLPTIPAPPGRVVATSRSLIAVDVRLDAGGGEADIVLDRAPLDLGTRVRRTAPVVAPTLAPRLGWPAIVLVAGTGLLVLASARHAAIERLGLPRDATRASPGDRVLALGIDLLPPLVLSWGVLQVDPVSLAFGVAVTDAELQRAGIGWAVAALACGLQTALLGTSLGQRAVGLSLLPRDPDGRVRRVRRGLARTLLVLVPPLAVLALLHPRLLALDDLVGACWLVRLPRERDDD